MICPKCGFNQPDDIYCAFCGVNIERYARGKRKRRYRAWILIALIGIAGLSVAKYIRSIHHEQTPQTVRKELRNENNTQVKGIASIGHKAPRPVSGTKLHTETKMGNRLEERSAKAPYMPDRLEDQALSENESVVSPTSEQQKAESDQGEEHEALTATHWFEEGKALDDDSEAEIRCYEKAIEIDPKFAPAYYRLGAIYYRQANFELADEKFANFLQYSSDKDKEAYNIHIYYSLGEAERLSERIKKEVPAEEEETETPTEDEKEAGQETSEEVMTIVKFSSINGHIMVPVILNDFLNATVLVDTGAGITVFSRKLARDLGLEGDLGNSITLKTMAMEIQAQTVRLDSIQVGGLRRNYFPVAITDLPLGEEGKFRGILGMDFMNNYKIHIDNKRQIITFMPKSP